MSHSNTTFGTERLGALSDGVFAIVLTLLVLDLKLPELPPGYAEPGMIKALEERIPNLIAWIISFVLVARIWIVHHSIVANLADARRMTVEGKGHGWAATDMADAIVSCLRNEG